MSDWIQDTLYDNGTLINKLGIRDEQELAKKNSKSPRKES